MGNCLYLLNHILCCNQAVYKILYYTEEVFEAARNRSDHDRMVIEFTSTNAITMSSNPAHGKVYSIRLYVEKFHSHFWQVGYCLRVVRFPSPIKLTATVYRLPIN